MTPVAHIFGRELEKHFIVVHWDQRGSGRSVHGVPPESLNLEQFLSDTHELIGMLRARFGVDRVYLLGHSWGSVLGLLTAQRHPELLHAYVGMGQVTDERRSEELGLAYVRQRARELGEEEALRELAGLKPPYLEDPRQAVIQRKWLSRFGGNFHDGKPFLLWRDIDRRWALSAIFSPEYSWLDLMRYLRANSRMQSALYEEFKHVNLMETVQKVDVPIYFLMGRHDHNKHPSLVQEYYERIEAPQGKTLIWFEDSAHSPCLEETSRFVETMVTRVLTETLAAQQGAAADRPQPLRNARQASCRGPSGSLRAGRSTPGVDWPRYVGAQTGPVAWTAAERRSVRPPHRDAACLPNRKTRNSVENTSSTVYSRFCRSRTLPRARSISTACLASRSTFWRANLRFTRGSRWLEAGGTPSTSISL